MRLTWRRRHGQRGVSLVEVLISTVVVSVGALSATSLQLVSKRTNRETAQRLEATHLASTLIERMRANNSAASLQAYVAAAGGGVGSEQLYARLQSTYLAQPHLLCTSAAYACTPGELAAAELFQWEQVMDGKMELIEGSTLKPGGLDRPTACVTASAAGFYTVTIAFRGAAALPDNPAVACGQNASRDGERLYGEQDQYRRTITLVAYIAPAVAK